MGLATGATSQLSSDVRIAARLDDFFYFLLLRSTVLAGGATYAISPTHKRLTTCLAPNKLHGMHGMCAAANCRDYAQQPDLIADLLDFGQVLGNPQPTQTRSMLLGVISALADFPESANCYLTPCDEACYNLTRLNCL